MLFNVNQLDRSSILRISTGSSFIMLCYSFIDILSDANIKISSTTLHNINIPRVLGQQKTSILFLSDAEDLSLDPERDLPLRS